jgi:hypothetical protein
MGFMALSGGPVAAGPPPSNGEAYENLERGQWGSGITIDGGAKDGAMPFGTTWAADDIHWRLHFRVLVGAHPLSPLFRADPLKPQVEIHGNHDRYPAYESIVIQSNGDFKDIHRRPPDSGALPGPTTLSPLSQVDIWGLTPIEQ